MAAPWRPQRARSMILAAIGMVLAGTLASYLYHRREAAPQPPPPKVIAEDVGQQTHSFTLSKTLGEHTLYTIRAEQVTNYEDTGQALLRDVSVLIFGTDGRRRDQITTAECLYDPAAASIWIPGEVQMQFALPAPSSGGDDVSIPITIYTAELSFEQATGIATTNAPVRFVFPQGEGRSQGAAYDPQNQILTLTAEASFFIGGQGRQGASPVPENSPAVSAGEQTVVHAGTVRFVRETGRAVLDHGVEVLRRSSRIRAARGEIELDGRLHVRQATLTGDVQAADETPAEFRQAAAQQGTIRFDDAGSVRSIALGDGVAWSIESRPPGSRKEGAARQVDLLFRDSGGALERIRAERDVRMSFGTIFPAEAVRDRQTLSGGEAELLLSPDGRFLRQVRLRSSPRLEIVPARAASDRHTITGEEFEIALDERGGLKRFQAQGNVRVIVEQDGAAASRAESRSDFLEALLHSSASAGSLESLRQWGHFEYRDAEWQARAEQASYVAAADRTTLEGRPSVWNAEGRLMADRIELERSGGGLRGEGNVAATLYQQPAPEGRPPEPLHVVSNRMRYHRAGRSSRFEGNARLWQGESFVVEAAVLEWSHAAGELTSGENVYSAFRQAVAGDGETAPGNNASGLKRHEDFVVITAATLVYQQPGRVARYRGEVRMQSAAGTMTANELEIVLAPPEKEAPGAATAGAGQIERAVASGGVKFAAGQRTGRGERAEYLPARQQVHLYGQPAQLDDPARGSVVGAKLTYFLGDDRIQVQGSPGSPTETRWQLHP